MSKLSAQGSNQDRPFKPIIYQGKGEKKVEIIMTKVDIKADIDPMVEIDIVNHHIKVDLSMDKIIQKDLSMFKITEDILGGEILEKCKTIDMKISEEDIE